MKKLPIFTLSASLLLLLGIGITTYSQANPTPENKVLVTSQNQQTITGKVINAQSKKPIEGAIITIGNEVAKSKQDGSFTITGAGENLLLRAPGYERGTFPLKNNMTIALKPFQVKALYLTIYGFSSSKLREDAINVLKKNNMNALVIDVKGDRGYIPFHVDIPMAKQIGAQNLILIKDMPGMLAELKKQNIYTIARIVTFKDNLLASAHPELAVHKGKGLFTDREGLHWTDPFKKEVWNYNVDIAKAAAKLGFDEVQFDYVRCPDTKGVVFSKPNNMENRTDAISTFLETAHKGLVPYNVMMSADIFGYVLWNLDDTGIGQKIDRALNAVDIVSPMLYPSGFMWGIPNYRNPVQHPYEIVNLTLKRGQERTAVSPLRFRPWLQAFHDYAFHGGDFKEARMQTQIKAAQDFGSSGYMFWNPRNVYPSGKFDH
jgi:hypothetical protein